MQHHTNHRFVHDGRGADADHGILRPGSRRLHDHANPAGINGEITMRDLCTKALGNGVVRVVDANFDRQAERLP